MAGCGVGQKETSADKPSSAKTPRERVVLAERFRRNGRVLAQFLARFSPNARLQPGADRADAIK
jgi:hypothetical protein